MIVFVFDIYIVLRDVVSQRDEHGKARRKERNRKKNIYFNDQNAACRLCFLNFFLIEDKTDNRNDYEVKHTETTSMMALPFSTRYFLMMVFGVDLAIFLYVLKSLMD